MRYAIMATTTKGVKSFLVAIAVILFGMGFATMAESKALAIALYVIAGIVTFFAVVVDTPTAELPLDLQKLKQELDSLSGLGELATLLAKYQKQIEAVLEALVNSDALNALVAMLKKYAPELEALLNELLKELQASGIDVSKIDAHAVVSKVAASVPKK